MVSFWVDTIGISPDGIFILRPMVAISLSVFKIGCIKTGLKGLHGLTQSPHRIIFSAFILISKERLRITRKTGHTLIFEDINSGTPSVDNESAKLLGLEKNLPD